VHPVGGEVICYLDLARRLSVELAVYGLRVPYGESTAEISSISRIARRYVELITDARPDGPYLLGGWSLGGPIAFEMARQLHEAGSEVELLVLLDPTPPRVLLNAPASDDELVLEFGRNWLDQISGGASAVPELLGRIDGPVSLRRLVDLGREADIVPPDLDISHVESRFEVFRWLCQSVAGYEPGRYSGPTSVLSADENRSRFDHPGMGWERRLDRVEAAWLPGDHFSLLRKPCVETVASQLLDRLERRGDR
jgi:thioesterase domain-containing protein